MKVTFIINPTAGSRKRRNRGLSSIEQFLSKSSQTDSGIDCDLKTIKTKGGGTQLSAEALSDGSDVVVAVGGDGTVNEVASALVNTDIPLGVIPMGSGNGFARSMKIPLNLKIACQTIIEGRDEKIDVGQVEGGTFTPCATSRYFFATAGVGLDALISWEYNREFKKWRGMLPYIYLTVKNTFSFEPEEITLQMGKKSMSTSPLIVTAANTCQYGGGAIIAPDASPFDGLLDICILGKISPAAALLHWHKLFSGEIKKMPHYHTHQSEKLTIIRKKPGPFHIDGEPQDGPEELSLRIIPKALKVRIPA